MYPWAQHTRDDFNGAPHRTSHLFNKCHSCEITSQEYFCPVCGDIPMPLFRSTHLGGLLANLCLEKLTKPTLEPIHFTANTRYESNIDKRIYFPAISGNTKEQYQVMRGQQRLQGIAKLSKEKRQSIRHKYPL